jgi:hypothetical protein
MRTIEFKIEVANVPDDLTPESLSEHKRRVLQHVEAEIDAHHGRLLKDEEERKKKAQKANGNAGGR